ncbi:RluA family pseudouridine synthase [Blattabacterium cuenoti]|uniref:RluA family pseudouridine synthase n=1 Tax=Blattabacterium cuenoti TaxID=1653831 RepID=UPI00163C9B99|nr:RluA family pseudouridine synthase [Blattabacterium cuenoti]
MSIKKFKFFLNKNQKLIRIDKFLKKLIPNISRNQIQNATYSGNILVNKHLIKKNYKIKPFDIIDAEIHYPIDLDPEYKNIIAENIPLNIIYEDEDILIINKPSGIVVHPGIGHKTGTLIHGIKYYLNNPNLFRSGLIHRIDKDTSGLLIVAKNEQSQKYLLQQFLSKTIQRKYIALVWGNLKKKNGTITGYIGRDPKNRKRMKLFKKYFHKGKYSITHYKVLEKFKYITSIYCYLETGKTHQIRAHFKYLGHPILNDYIYGGNKIKNIEKKQIKFLKNYLKFFNRHALHAISLSFIHPKKGKCNFTCSIPEEWKKLLEKFRKKLL